MPLPLGVVAAEGKQIDVNFVEKQTGPYSGNTNAWGFGAINIDALGSIYTFSRDNSVLSKQLFTGTLNWSIYNNTLDNFNACTDSNGNTYLVGAVFGTPNKGRIVKINTLGTIVFSNEFLLNGGYSIMDRPSIAVDAQGFLYVAAQSVGNGSLQDTGYYILKFDSNGNNLWVQFLNQNIPDPISLMGLAVNSTAGSYCFYFMQSGFNYLTFIYGSTTTGNVTWYKQSPAYTYTFAGTQTYQRITMDNAGNIYVSASRTTGEEQIMKISFNGTVLNTFDLQVSNLPGQITSPAGLKIQSLVLAPSANSIYLLSTPNTNPAYWALSQFDLNLNNIFTNGMRANYTLPSVNGLAISPIRNFIFMAGTIPNNGSNTAATGLGFKLPNDGTKTGTTSWGLETYTYASGTLTRNAGTALTLNNFSSYTPIVGSIVTSLWTPTFTSSPVTLTQATIN